MDWIIELIKKHTNADGVVDTDAVANAINDAAPKYVVPKHKYNEVSNKLKEANDTIESFEEKDTSELEGQLEELASAYEAQSIYYAKRDALVGAGAKTDDIEFLMWKLGDEFEMNEEGEIEGIDEAVKSIQEKNAKYFPETDPNAGKDKDSEKEKEGAGNAAGWKPIDNKLESGKTPSSDAPLTLRGAIEEHYSQKAE